MQRTTSLATAGRLLTPLLVASLAATTFLAASPVLGQSAVDPKTVVGRETCATCHVKELAAWQESAHAKSAWEKLSHPKAADFAKGIGMAAGDVKKSGTCIACHGTEQADGQIAHGNSCESCHGGAGGTEGWLETHADYGSGIAGKTQEQLLKELGSESADHRAARIKSCQEAGMVAPEDAMAIARNCLACHIVPNEDLIKAGHPSSDKFELFSFAQGEVRHNFLLKQGENNEAPSLWLSRHDERDADGRRKLMFVAGQLADLEISLEARAKVKGVKRGTLGRLLNDRIDDAIGEIEDLVKDGVDELKPVLDAVDGIDKKTLRKVDDGVAALTANAAAKVKDAAAKFIQAHPHGDKLPKIKTKKPKGDVYK